MSKRIFTNKEIGQVLKNKHVTKCSERSITYHTEFKIHAVKRYKQGMTSTEIFKQAGFDLDLIGRGQPKECLKRWRRMIRKNGVKGLAETRGRTGGRPKKIQDKSDAEKIKRLEIEVAYLKAENDFLARLRAKRTE